MTTPEQARKLALLWAAGKMVGGDAHEVAIALYEKMEQLERQVEELQADAERYRWLKNTPWLDTPIERTITLQKNALWDAEIDAARNAK